MSRKLIENLIINLYEVRGKADKIKKGDNFMFLSGLIITLKNDSEINLGREVKSGLDRIKSLGDRSAHNRRYLSNRKDLLEIKPILRLAVQELLGLTQIVNKD